AGAHDPRHVDVDLAARVQLAAVERVQALVRHGQGTSEVAAMIARRPPLDKPHRLARNARATGERPMRHQRLRKFNQTQMRYYDRQRLSNDMCMVVIADGHVFVRGQTGHDMAGNNKIALGDAAAQADQAMQNVKTLLAEAGATLEDVVRV